MSSLYHHHSKTLQLDSTADKENNSSSSDVSFEQQFSQTRKYRKITDELSHSIIVEPTQALPKINMQNPVLHKIFNKSDSMHSLDGRKLEKSFRFDKILNGRPKQSFIIPRDRKSLNEKENKTSLMPRQENDSLGETTKAVLVENKKSFLVESIKMSLIEKQPAVSESVAKPVERKVLEQATVKDSCGIEQEDREVKEVIDFKEQCNKGIREYVPSIIKALIERDKDSTPVFCLQKHNITARVRAKMIDWMVEVLGTFKCLDQTFFIAVNIMDLYLQKTEAILENVDVHIIGVTAMLIASKYEEIYPLQMNKIYENITHKKISPDQLKQKEMEILTTMNYKLTNTTPYEFMMSTLFHVDLKAILPADLYNYFLKLCVYLAKTTLHDYELMNQQTYSILAASTLFVAFKVIEPLAQSFPLTDTMAKVREFLQVKDTTVVDCAERILAVAKNFDKLYPNLENLNKFYSFNFVSGLKDSNQAPKNVTNSQQESVL